MFLSLLAATLTFTATATGVEKGAPVEFFLAGPDSDRDYETMFLLDESVETFAKRLDKAGFPRGKPEDLSTCVLWPVGVPVSFSPAPTEFLETTGPDEVRTARTIYTGGGRLANDFPEAATNMPLSVLCHYSLSQSLFVLDGHFEQGNVYNCHLAKKKLEKGTRVTFTVSCDEKGAPHPLSLVLKPGNGAEIVRQLKDESSRHPLDVCLDFDPSLTVAEAKGLAEALALIDSQRVKINGFQAGHLFYKAFLPLVKWQDRQERMVQPFELTIGSTNRLVYIEEDWNVDGLDPKLTPREIPLEYASEYPKTDTCFIYAPHSTRLGAIYAAMAKLAKSAVRTWYVFGVE